MVMRVEDAVMKGRGYVDDDEGEWTFEIVLKWCFRVELCFVQSLLYCALWPCRGSFWCTDNF